MATVSEIDWKLDELKRQAAALKEQRKVAAAKEREQARKWKAATLAAIGEIVLKTLGADWTDIDLEGLQGWARRQRRGHPAHGGHRPAHACGGEGGA